MSIFDTIKNAIFGHAPAAAQPAPAQPAQQPAAQAPAMPQMAQPQPQAAAPAAPAQVDVEAVLTQRMHDRGDPSLNWRTSIVDLMKLLDLDSSLANRNQLAEELGYTGPRDGSAEMNMWLHRHVMRKLAASGGTVPAELQH